MEQTISFEFGVFLLGTFTAALVTGIAGFAFGIIAAAIWLNSRIDRQLRTAGSRVRRMETAPQLGDRPAHTLDCRERNWGPVWRPRATMDSAGISPDHNWRSTDSVQPLQLVPSEAAQHEADWANWRRRGRIRQWPCRRLRRACGNRDRHLEQLAWLATE